MEEFLDFGPVRWMWRSVADNSKVTWVLTAPKKWRLGVLCVFMEVRQGERNVSVSLRTVWRDMCGVCSLDFSGPPLRFGHSTCYPFLAVSVGISS
jgi:hypothetical protein